MISVWTKQNSKSGKELAKALFLPINVEADTIIRWGNTEAQSYSAVEINSRNAILRASDKPLARKILQSEAIPVPIETETDFPVIGRARYHRAGSSFFLCHSPIEVMQAKMRGAIYFSKLYPKTREIRVHIAGGRTILMSEKEGDKTKIIWNHRKSDFKFRHLARHVWLEDNLLMQAQRYAKRAIEVLGLDFGAVDIMLLPQDNQAPIVVTEVNTAPSLSPLAIEKYVNYFNSL